MARVQLYGGPFDGLVVESKLGPVHRVALIDEKDLCLSLDKALTNGARIAVYYLRYIPHPSKTGRRVPRYEFERIEP